MSGALTTLDHFVDHVSTVPVIAGQAVKLYLREKARADLLDHPAGFKGALLMLHGGYWPCTPAFDLAHEDYSWMAALARQGWDVYAMDMTGYGRSPRPLMDDPRNLDPAQQPLLIPGTLSAPVEPLYPFDLVTSDSEADDIDRVVEFIRARRGLVGRRQPQRNRHRAPPGEDRAPRHLRLVELSARRLQEARANSRARCADDHPDV
jgi:pimeloyl-ACP methyl ester carboxylesterase